MFIHFNINVFGISYELFFLLIDYNPWKLATLKSQVSCRSLSLHLSHRILRTRVEIRSHVTSVTLLKTHKLDEGCGGVWWRFDVLLSFSEMHIAKVFIFRRFINIHKRRFFFLNVGTPKNSNDYKLPASWHLVYIKMFRKHHKLKLIIRWNTLKVIDAFSFCNRIWILICKQYSAFLFVIVCLMLTVYYVALGKINIFTLNTIK